MYLGFPLPLSSNGGLLPILQHLRVSSFSFAPEIDGDNKVGLPLQEPIENHQRESKIRISYLWDWIASEIRIGLLTSWKSK